jgi:hypothetical protein
LFIFYHIAVTITVFSSCRLFPAETCDVTDVETDIPSSTVVAGTAGDQAPSPSTDILAHAERTSTYIPGSSVVLSSDGKPTWSLSLDSSASVSVRSKLATRSFSPSVSDCYWDAHGHETQKVSVRIRPMSVVEVEAGGRRIVSTTDKIMFPTSPPRGADADLCQGVLAVVNPSAFDADPDVVAAAANAANFPEWAKVFSNFDHCFWAQGAHESADSFSTQLDVFVAVGRDIVSHVCRGMSSTCIAYGPVGSGKSYSMFGPPAALAAAAGVCQRGAARSAATAAGPQAVGLLPRVFSAVVRNILSSGAEANLTLESIAQHSVGGCDTRIVLSFYELHNDKLRDLLTFDSAESSLPVLKPREHPVVGPYVSGLRRVEITSVDQLIKLLHNAQCYRSNKWAGGVFFPVGKAHAVITLELTPMSQGFSDYDPSSASTTPLAAPNRHRQFQSGRYPTPNSGGAVHTSPYKCVKLQMVDLAGSERDTMSQESVSSSGGRAAGKRDSKFIAQSLAALGNVIRGLGKLARAKLGRSDQSLAGLEEAGHNLELGSSSGSLGSSAVAMGRPTPLPFRESLLTWLLKDGLCQGNLGTSATGNCFVSLLAHVSPSSTCYDETMQALAFADSVSLQNAQVAAELRKSTASALKRAAVGPGSLKTKLLLHSRSCSEGSPNRGSGLGSSPQINLLHELISDPQQRLAKMNLKQLSMLNRGSADHLITPPRQQTVDEASDHPVRTPIAASPHATSPGPVPAVGSPDYKELQSRLMELRFELQNTRVDRDSLNVELAEANSRITVLQSKLSDACDYHGGATGRRGLGRAGSFDDLISDADSLAQDEAQDDPVYSPYSALAQATAQGEAAENAQNVLYLRSLIERKDDAIEKLMQELVGEKEESARLEQLTVDQRVEFAQKTKSLQQ